MADKMMMDEAPSNAGWTSTGVLQTEALEMFLDGDRPKAAGFGPAPLLLIGRIDSTDPEEVRPSRGRELVRFNGVFISSVLGIALVRLTSPKRNLLSRSAMPVTHVPGARLWGN